MNFIKQSTATALMVGPFLDSTDGYTLETALTIPSGNIRLSKNGGAFAATSSAISLTHNESGWYSGTFNTTDTDTLGSLTLSIYVSGALPVWKDYTVVPATIYDWFIGTSSLSVTTSGLTSAALGSIVTSGTAAGWSNSTTPVTVSGLTSAALGSIVTSGNTAGWSNSTTAVTVSGLTAPALSQIVSSGNAASWNDDIVTVSGLTSAALSQIVSSGTAAGWATTDGVQVTVTGLVAAALSQIVASGDAAGWDATAVITAVTVSGFTPYALSEIVTSGNAANWSGVTPVTDLTTVNTKLDTISGYTDTLEGSTTTVLANQATINTNVLALPDISEIVASGNAEGWNGSNSEVTVTGLAPSALSEIVTSGTAAGWSSASEVGPIVTGIFNEVLTGSLTFRDAQIEQWAYSANDVNLSGTSSGIYHSYYDPTDSGLFVLFATPSGRIRTDL